MDNLQEAYLSVYEATAMAKRGLDEPAIRQQIAARTGGGQSADRATALENQPTYGNSSKEKQRQNLARKQRGDFRNTTSSNPGLHVGQHKSNDPKVKALQSARGAQRGVLTPNEKKQLNMGDESFDLFDYLLEYLVAEGYANTNENAIAIMANMSEDWRAEILDEARVDWRKGKLSGSGRSPEMTAGDRAFKNLADATTTRQTQAVRGPRGRQAARAKKAYAAIEKTTGDYNSGKHS